MTFGIGVFGNSDPPEVDLGDGKPCGVPKKRSFSETQPLLIS